MAKYSLSHIKDQHERLEKDAADYGKQGDAILAETKANIINEKNDKLDKINSSLYGNGHGNSSTIGGGTTGISILKDGRVVYTVDEPTGGTHMNLVISGAYGISIPEAEAYKRNEANKRDVYATIRPVVEKMAAISKRALQEGGYEKGTPIVVVGGASNFEEFTKTFSQYIGLPVHKPLYPEFVTPLGIAMGSEL